MANQIGTNMKRQCRIIFLGERTLIIRDKDSDGASSEFDTTASYLDNNTTLRIKVNHNICGNLFKQYLHHELLESALVILGKHFKSNSPNSDDKFFMLNHSDLTLISDAVSVAYDEIITKIGV